MCVHLLFLFLFFFNDPATTAIYTLSLHDALPICDLHLLHRGASALFAPAQGAAARSLCVTLDRKSTRLNSSHVAISYAVFCLKKKSPYRSDPLCSGPLQAPSQPARQVLRPY